MGQEQNLSESHGGKALGSWLKKNWKKIAAGVGALIGVFIAGKGERGGKL